MSAYLTGLIAISSLIGVCSYISYGDREDKYLKTASSLILAYVVILPIVTLVKDASDYTYDGTFWIDSFDSINDTELGESAELAFCDGVKKYVCSQFSLSEENVRVRVFGFDFANMKAEKIKVILSGSAIFADNRAISEQIEKNGLGECEVELSVK